MVASSQYRSLFSAAQAFDELRSDYDMVRSTRFQRRRTGVSGVGRNADFHYRSESEYLRMTEIARDIARNDPVVGQGIRRLTNNVIQNGFKVDPQTGDKEADKILKEAWEKWAGNRASCHAARKFTFREIERIGFQHIVTDGDSICLPLDTGKLETIENHRLRTPHRTQRPVVHGIMLDEMGGPTEYWLTKDNHSPYQNIQKVSDIKRYPAFDEHDQPQVYHLHYPNRFTQNRGVTALAPIGNIAGMHDDVQFAKLVQQQIASCFAILRERGPEYEYAEGQTTPVTDADGRTMAKFAPGMEFIGAKGETLKGFSPDIPSPTFFDHAHMLLTFIAINLDLPVMLLLLDPSQTNFSGWRGAMDQAKLGFKAFQQGYSERLHTPAYLWKVTHFLQENPRLQQLAMKQGVNIFGHSWYFPSWPYIEPVKDTTANKLRVESFQANTRGLLAERGVDYDEFVVERIEDNANFLSLAIQRAKELSEEHGVDVDYHELLNIPAPQNVKVVVNENGNEQPASDKPTD
ncbi:Phage portal protein, lambda family [Polystyrenella longa]|uniref:Phage portal protein, lambda family n=1 Tax=Polystyrenella longa TaxID=2528007 RepID=A0A518CTW5_9PLAN|nr:phage portal protein [Polystyrenella longa]QDU82670.1 Phage portal protein, lambda family [Polystyrenella longa]